LVREFAIVPSPDLTAAGIRVASVAAPDTGLV
jgi:hypothetical protein